MVLQRQSFTDRPVGLLITGKPYAVCAYSTVLAYSSSNPMLWLYTVVWGGGGSRAV